VHIRKKIKFATSKKGDAFDAASEATWLATAQIGRNNLSNRISTSERRNHSPLDPSPKDSGNLTNPAHSKDTLEAHL
jgi:hypothetical protein